MTHLTTMARRLALLGGTLMLFSVGCADNEDQTKTTSDQPTVGKRDRTTSPEFSVNESALSATVGDDVRIRIPIEVDGKLSGEATVRILTLEDDLVGQATQSFSIEGAGPIEVALPATALPAAGLEEVKHLVEYSVRAGKSSVIGYKSLLYVLPKVDLRTRIPAQLQEGGQTVTRVFALDPTTDTPLKDTPITLTLTGPNGDLSTFEAVTDETGSAVITLPAPEVGTYALQTSAGSGAVPLAMLENDLEVVRQARVLVTTDKPIYQPGQTLNVRTLALKKPALDAVANVDAILEVYDGKGNMVFRERTKTNEFGIASTRMKIASQVNNGNWQVKAIVGETESTKTVEVKPYSLPKFAVETTLDSAYYLPNETISGVINARYFFGKSVDGGTVKVEAGTFDTDFVTFAEVSGQTNDEGLYPFEITLPGYLVGQPLENGNALITLAITVTDTAGQEEVKAQSVVVSQNALNVVAIPESGRLEPGLKNSVLLFATDPLGMPADATFDVKVIGAEGTPAGPVSLGIATLDVLPKSDQVSIEVTATLSDGTTVNKTFDLSATGNEGLLVRTDKSLYEVGQTASISVLAGQSSGRLFLDVIKDGQTVLTTGADIVDGVANYALDLDGSLAGDLVVEAYRITGEAAIVRDKKLIFVADAKSLSVALDTDKSQYRPGEPAELTFTVQDENGAPAVAAVGVQIVDEAVYALTEMKPGLLETWFQIQEALREPQYQIDGVSFDLPSVIMTPTDDESAQVVAGAAFAALDTSVAAGEASSWSQLLTGVPSALSAGYDQHITEITGFFSSLKDAGVLTVDNAPEVLANLDTLYDYWGNAYALEPVEDWNGWRVRVTSMGPDERADTADDFSKTINAVTNDYWQEEGPWPAAGGGGGDGGDWDAAFDDGGPPMNPEANEKSGGDGPKVRKDFPETLLFEPALITGPDGKATITLDMADSITEWRVSSVANTKAGALGSAVDGITVFQEFFVDIDFPASLTRNDEVTFPIAVYNYLPTAQSVTVSLEPADWFTPLGETSTTVELAPNQVLGLSFPVRVDTVGLHALTVTGLGTEMSDAVQRVVRVKPDGVEEMQSVAGRLEGTATHAVSFPDATIDNSHDLQVKIYPGIMAQAVEGLDSMLQQPHGCFEQTTASNWPNTLVLDYLRSTGQTAPEIELKALDYLHQGYQRLLTFECTGGGFVWFGDPAPANVILSAMGVLEFSDMAKVIEVDENVISRTADWVIGDQLADGHWTTDQGSEFATVQYDDFKTTAFVTWALAESPYGAEAVTKSTQWLAAELPNHVTDAYALAMAGLAFAHADHSKTGQALDELAKLAEVADDGTVKWVVQGGGGYWGDSGSGGVSPTSIEVTALAVQAFLASGQHLDLVQGAIGFLAGQKDGLGNYGTTHATILTLRAMIKSLSNKTEEGEGTITVKIDGQVADTLQITEDNRNVFHQMELASLVNPAAGGDVSIEYVGTGNLMYQVVWSGWVPAPEGGHEPGEAMDLSVAYDKTQLEVNDIVTATVTAVNKTDAQLDMVMLDLGVPPGFDVVSDSLVAAVAAQEIMKFEVPGQQISIYLEKLAPNETKELTFQLVAKYPVKAKSPDSSAYLYYNPDQATDVVGAEFEVQ